MSKTLWTVHLDILEDGKKTSSSEFSIEENLCAISFGEPSPVKSTFIPFFCKYFAVAWPNAAIFLDFK